ALAEFGCGRPLTFVGGDSGLRIAEDPARSGPWRGSCFVFNRADFALSPCHRPQAGERLGPRLRKAAALHGPPVAGLATRRVGACRTPPQNPRGGKSSHARVPLRGDRMVAHAAGRGVERVVGPDRASDGGGRTTAGPQTPRRPSSRAGRVAPPAPRPWIGRSRGPADPSPG